MRKWGNALFYLSNMVVRETDMLRGRHRRTPPSLASRGEIAVADALSRLGIRYKTQYRLGYCYHVDFACWAEGKFFLIEYDGRQHYRPGRGPGKYRKFLTQILHDRLERMECNSRCIPLLRIKYNVPYSRIGDRIKNFYQRL